MTTTEKYDRLRLLASRSRELANARLADFRSGKLKTRREFRILEKRALTLYRAAVAAKPPTPTYEPPGPSIDTRRKDRLRRTAQAGLRKLGFERETTTESGSSYYVHGTGMRVRVSDHGVPMTAAREVSSWTWATHGWSIMTDPSDATVRKVRQTLSLIEKDLAK